MIERIRTYLERVLLGAEEGHLADPEQVRNLTILVLAISFIFGVYIGFFDPVWTQVLAFITNVFTPA